MFSLFFLQFPKLLKFQNRFIPLQIPCQCKQAFLRVPNPFCTQIRSKPTLFFIAAIRFCCPDKITEQRMRPIRTGPQLRMELNAHKPTQIRQLYNLHQPFVRRSSGQFQAMLCQYFSELVVKLIPMPMPLVDQGLPAVSLFRLRICL